MLNRNTRINPIGRKRRAEASGPIYSSFSGPRVRINPRSKKRIAQDRDYYAIKIEGLPCADCGKPATERHHKQSLGRGGNRTDRKNIVPLCGACHRIRHATNRLKSGHQHVIPTPGALPVFPIGGNS